MFKLLLYPIFGIAVIGAYAGAAASGSDLSSVPTSHSAVPAQYRAAGAWQAAPLVWKTGFHGPAAYVPPTIRYSGGGGYGGSRRYGGGGYYGGGFGGK